MGPRTLPGRVSADQVGPGQVSAEEAEPEPASAEADHPEVWAGTCCQTEQTEAAGSGAEGELPAEVSAEAGLWVLLQRRL